MRLVSCFFTLLVVASVPFHPALAESQSDIDPVRTPDRGAQWPTGAAEAANSINADLST